MIQLSANHCEALVELIHSGGAPVDMIEIGPWMALKQVPITIHQLPGWKFQFHPGSLIAGVGLLPGTVRKIKAYMDATQSLWASFHATLLPPPDMNGWRRKKVGTCLSPTQSEPPNAWRARWNRPKRC
jgi:hypothetical protein